MSCLFDSRWSGSHGIGRFAMELSKRLPVEPLTLNGRPMSPLDPLRLSMLRFRPGEWLLSPGYNAPLFSDIDYVFTIHDLNHVDRDDNSGRLKRLYYREVLSRLCARARAILTVSEFSRGRVLDWFCVPEARVFNVGNGVSSQFSTDGPSLRRDRPYFLCVSNRRGHKNELGLLSAFARTGAKSRFDLLLTGAPTEALLNHADACGISRQVHYSGSVTEKSLAAMYRGATALLFPSFYEGFGLPIVEAFASGTPVITSNVTSMPEIAGDAALLVDPADPESIAHSIDLVADDALLRESMITAGLERSAHFNWDLVAARVRQAVESVNAGRSSAMEWSKP